MVNPTEVLQLCRGQHKNTGQKSLPAVSKLHYCNANIGPISKKTTVTSFKPLKGIQNLFVCGFFPKLNVMLE